MRASEKAGAGSMRSSITRCLSVVRGDLRDVDRVARSHGGNTGRKTTVFHEVASQSPLERGIRVNRCRAWAPLRSSPGALNRTRDTSLRIRHRGDRSPARETGAPRACSSATNADSGSQSDEAPRRRDTGRRKPMRNRDPPGGMLPAFPALQNHHFPGRAG
jgi:hypothetical protein